MAYESVMQKDAGPARGDATSPDITSVGSRSPEIPQLPLAPFSFSFEELPHQVNLTDPAAKPTSRDSKVSKILSTLTASTNSYDLVEDDDYEEPQAQSATQPSQKVTQSRGGFSVQSTSDLPVRTASVSRQLPLNHPKPDLQSLQGAYVRNVERLEESAERLSMTSSLEESLARIGRDPFPDITSGPSYITSPVTSTKSPPIAQTGLSNRQSARLSRLDPAQSGSFMSDSLGKKGVKFGPELLPHAQDRASMISRSASNASPERPGSAGSGDTYQQARTLFTDFDGVHYNANRVSRRISLSHPPRARDSKAFREPQPGEEMIYYPAPVPVMLNLPVRLSKMNWSDREKKRLQALSDMPDNMRQSAPWLASEELPTPTNRQSMAKLPPQLRASAFFDHRGTEMNVQLKDGSAVATLESILDAAAHAPVSAFTDHPIVGHLGKEVYGPSAKRKSLHPLNGKKAKRKSSANTLLKAGDAKSNLAVDDDQQSKVAASEHPEHEVHDSEDGADVDDPASDSDEDGDDEEQKSESEAESEEEEHEPGFSRAPTTLLAELQMRKAQQKQRNRTAADAFPNGMHSTLLELDTVTQLQQRARKQKHITLAWEDRHEADKTNFDDDDVPLGMLFPEKDRNEAANVNRPLGLMEKRELEENEPLSSRRARLRGEPLIAPQISQAPSNVDEAPRLEEPGLEEDAEETLGQRLKRLRELKENGSTSDFARDVNSELGLQVPQPEPAKTKTPDPEETLGQRRRRLKEEAAKNAANGTMHPPTLKKTGSMADLLRNNPVQYTHPHESNTAIAAMQTYQQQLQKDPAYLAQQQAAAAMAQGFGTQASHQMGMPNTYMGNAYGPSSKYYGSNIQSTVPGYGAPGVNSAPFPYGIPGYGNAAGAFDLGPPLDAKQRATIDQWRQGIA